MNKKSILILISVLLSIIVYLVWGHPKKLTLDPSDVAFQKVDLISDKNLAGGSGLEFGHAGRIWMNSLNGYSDVYSGRGEVIKTKNEKGQMVDLKVKISGTPTSLVFTDENSPDIFLGDSFIFATKEGRIFGWHKLANGLEPLVANLRFDGSKNGSEFTGITNAKSSNEDFFYVADYGNNKILKFNQNYQLLSVNFTDPKLPENYLVFNVKNLNNYIYATYKNKNSENGGVVNIFDLNGNFVKRLITDGQLNSPWGLASTENTFGQVTGNLLVGNSSDGEINMYTLTDGKFIETAKNENGDVLKIPGLEALTFGTNNGAGTVNELFFSAATPDGLGEFGKLQLVLSPDSPSQDRTVSQSSQTLTAEDKVEEEFLTESNLAPSYQDFKNNLEKNCLQNCLQEKLSKNLSDTSNLYNKIFSDAKIIQAEFQAQNFPATNTEKINAFLLQLQKLDPQKLQNLNASYCEILANDYYTGDKLKEMANTCLLYKTEIWLKELYILRTIFIRVELGPIGTVQSSGKKIQTKAFQDLIDSEEANISKEY